MQCKVLPEQDVRAGRWKQLTVEGGSGGSFSAAANPAGNFKMGGQGGDAGQRTTLSAAAAVGATQITVANAAALGVNAWIAIGPVATPETKQITAVDTANNRYTLDSALASAHAVGEA